MRTFNKNQKLPGEILTKDECFGLLDSFGDDFIGVRNRALITVYWRSQLRCNEALDLAPFDLNLEKPSITVKNGKGGKRRVVGIDKESLPTLFRWIDIRDKSCKYLFHSRKSTRIHDSYVRRMLKTAFKRAGYGKRIHAHALRHTGAHEMACEKIDIRIISRQLGHSSLAVTHTYLDHLCPEDVIEAVSCRTSF